VAAEDPGAVAAVLPSGERPIRAAEVVGGLSSATDPGTGQALEHALRTAVLAVRLGELAGASAQELVDTYYVALLHSSGCTSDGHEAAQLYGDDIVPRAAFALVYSRNPPDVLAFLRSNVWLGFISGPRAALEHVFERWDGLGFPGVARGDEIPLPMLLLHVARDISVFLTAAGPEEARAVVERRSGTAYEPRLAALAV